jgi:SAM-dependent methyltransferase
MKGIVVDQEHFFDLESEKNIHIDKDNFFYNYVMRGLINKLKVFKKCERVIDFGCGTGMMIDIFSDSYKNSKVNFVGLDISKKCIEKAKNKYPQHEFHKISNNTISQIEVNSCDGAYLVNVLHHSKNHQKIYQQIYSKLSVGSKFIIYDLSSENPIVELGRKYFIHLPKNAKSRFKDDLVIDGKIPEKYKVNIEQEIKWLKKANFTIQNVDRWQLFLFVFAWLDKFIPFSKTKFGKFTLMTLQKFEEWLIKFDFFKNKCECFYLECQKNSD